MKKIYLLALSLLGVWLITMLLVFAGKNNPRTPSEKNGFTPATRLELLLYANKDMIVNPPLTWEQLKKEVERIKTDYPAPGLSAMALGRAENVAYSAEIFVLLLEQSGGSLIDLNSPAGVSALKFLLEFATPGKKVYTWDESRANSLMEFQTGKLAMVIARRQDEKEFSGIKFSVSPWPKIALSQKDSEFPVLSHRQEIIIKDMIEQAALNRLTPEAALKVAGEELTQNN